MLCKYKIDTKEQLTDFITETESKMKSLVSDRTKIYNKLRRCDDPEQIKKLKSERDSFSQQIMKCRKEVKIANNIVNMRETIQDNIQFKTTETDISISNRTPKKPHTRE